MEPRCEAFESSGGSVRVERLLAVLVPGLQKLSLVMVSPDNLQVSMDVELFRVGYLELLEPPAQSFPSGVMVERSGNVLRVEPFQSACGNVSAVLGTIGLF